MVLGKLVILSEITGFQLLVQTASEKPSFSLRNQVSQWETWFLNENLGSLNTCANGVPYERVRDSHRGNL